MQVIHRDPVAESPEEFEARVQAALLEILAWKLAIRYRKQAQRLRIETKPSAVTMVI